MENDGKVQETPQEKEKETPDEVQQQAELTEENKTKEEAEKEEKSVSEEEDKISSEKEVIEEEEIGTKTEEAASEVQSAEVQSTENEPDPTTEAIVSDSDMENLEEKTGEEEDKKSVSEEVGKIAIEQEEKNAKPEEVTSDAEPTETESAEASKEVDSESEGEEEDEEEEELDFDHSSKEDLLAKIREVKNEESVRKLDRILKALKPRFDELYEVAKNEALQKFVSEGNEADSFEYHGDESDKEFVTLYGQLRARRNKHFQDLQNQREDNLKKKERLLEQLREIVDGDESVHSINSVRELQDEWKKTGPVPGAQNKTLWANYNALLDRYYDNRSIYFELKDLDRKKNLGLKQELCAKAEALNEVGDLKDAIIQLNELHEEYKHIGPVPKEEQENLWQRFKAASDAIYAKRKDYFEELKVQFDANLVKKEELIKEVESFSQFASDRISEWNAKTKEILDLQKKWEAIGGVPKEKAKATNRAFWNAFKGFFSMKNQFFKELDSKREDNLIKKQELIRQVEELKESDEWDSTAQKLKNLQAQWKDIGPVPEKIRNETYKKFKDACDHFFNRRRDQNKEKFKEYDENLNLKLQVCDQLEAAAGSAEPNLDDIYDLVDNYSSIGFVPKAAIKKINRRYDEVIAKVMESTLSDRDKEDLKNHIQMSRIRSTPGGERKIQRREHSIKRKISTLENDIATWNTNMEFFAASATADKLKAEMQEKIDAARKELEDLKSQLIAMS